MMKIPLHRHNKALVIFLMTVSILLVSCEKVIDIDLNSSDPHIVIEGSISDGTDPCTVRICRTVNFDEKNEFPSVTGADVVVSDDRGKNEVLTESEPGTYKTYNLAGEPGRIYTLKVVADGKEYVAVSTMPEPVYIDSLRIQNLSFGGNKSKVLNVYFQDPPNIKNYYRFVEERNGIVTKYLFLFEDRIQDGNALTVTLFAEEDTLRTGDNVLIHLQTIDKNVYDFFRTTRQAGGGGGPQAASPANPISNISSGALGYFSAYAERRMNIVVY